MDVNLFRQYAKFAGAVAAATLLLCHAGGEDYGKLRRSVGDLGRLSAPPEMYPAEGFSRHGNIRALFFDGLPYRGRPTRVFAWYGAPQGRQGKMPGVVLVQGGGGTAYHEWVQKWNEHGFAAISIAVEGQTDERAPEDQGIQEMRWKRHQWPGPWRQGIYADTGEPLADQWMYHAVADTVLANSLIRSFPEVDAGKVGLMGTSWGGVITSTVMGIDTRFAFAIPTYGCGAMATAGNQWGRALHDNTFYREVWDPVLWLPKARMPAFWFTWLHDVHFPLTSQSASYRAAPGPRMVAVLPDMKHSHPASWNPPDSYAFAESAVRAGKPWLRQLSLHGANGKAVAEFESGKKLESASLFSTTETGFTGSRNWVESKAEMEQRDRRARVSAPLPAGTKAWLMNVRAGNLTASSDFVEQ
jgi:dienelactone hydrolase